MSDSTGPWVSGQCLCGGVAFTVTGPLRDVFDCHCHRCRRWTGHHMAATAAAPEHIVFSSSGSLRWYSPEPSVEYGFCQTCGSSLFWNIVGRTSHWSICAGVLDPPTGLRTTSAWYLDEASDYADPSPGIADRHATE